MKKLSAFILALFIAFSASVTAFALRDTDPQLDVDEIFLAEKNSQPKKIDHSGSSLRTAVTPGSTIYFSIKNARRAEVLNGYRAVLEWSKGEDYVTSVRIEYREMFDFDGVTSLDYRYVIAMNIADFGDDAAHTLRGRIKLAQRRTQNVPEVSFTVSVKKDVVEGETSYILCNTPELNLDFPSFSDIVFIDFGGFCGFEVNSRGQDSVDIGCNFLPITNIAECYREAQLRFITWNKRPFFDHAGKLTVYSSGEEWLYELRGGKLYDISDCYREEEGAFVLVTHRLEGLVISDRELMLDVPQIPEPNPPTAAFFATGNKS